MYITRFYFYGNQRLSSTFYIVKKEGMNVLVFKHLELTLNRNIRALFFVFSVLRHRLVFVERLSILSSRSNLHLHLVQVLFEQFGSFCFV